MDVARCIFFPPSSVAAAAAAKFGAWGRQMYVVGYKRRRWGGASEEAIRCAGGTAVGELRPFFAAATAAAAG